VELFASFAFLMHPVFESELAFSLAYYEAYELHYQPAHPIAVQILLGFPTKAIVIISSLWLYTSLQPLSLHFAGA
jgi:hypothetical protein